MNKNLNNVIKGLIVALVIILTGGIISLNLKVSPNSGMVLVSSSLVNAIKTENETKEEENEPVDTVVEEVEIETKEIEEKEEVKEEKVEEKVEEPAKVETPAPEPAPTQTPEPEPVKPSVPEASGSYSPNNNTASSSGVSATYTGLVTAYGPDCYGCYGSMTAMGDYVGDGNIYYNHPTYGTIRIVAGDKSILNKVVRITGLNISSEPVIAIVRDTGGDIGFNKPKGIILDLLYTSERSPEVLNFGMQQATVEVLN